MPSGQPDLEAVREAARLYRETEAIVGPGHPEALRAHEALGDAYLKVRDYPAAQATFEEAYLRRVHQHGEDDYSAQRDALKLSVALRELGQCERALALQERAGEVLEAMYGPDRPAVWHALEQRRQTLVAMGRMPEAVVLQAEVARRKQAALGLHVETVKAVVALGKLSVGAGDPEGAKEAYGRAAGLAELVDVPLRLRLDLCRLRMELARDQKDWPVAGAMIEILLDRCGELPPDDELRHFLERRRRLFRLALKSIQAQASKTGSDRFEPPPF